MKVFALFPFFLTVFPTAHCRISDTFRDFMGGGNKNPTREISDNPHSGCGGLLEGQSGRFIHHGPHGNSTPTTYRNCIWVIKLLYGTGINFTTTGIITGSSVNVYNLTTEAYDTDDTQLPAVTLTRKDSHKAFELAGDVLIVILRGIRTCIWFEWNAIDDKAESNGITSAAYVDSTDGNLEWHTLPKDATFAWVVNHDNEWEMTWRIRSIEDEFCNRTNSVEEYQILNVFEVTSTGDLNGVARLNDSFPLTTLETNASSLILLGRTVGLDSETCGFEASWSPTTPQEPTPSEKAAAALSYPSTVPNMDTTPAILIATDPSGVKMYSPESRALEMVNNQARSGGVAFDHDMGIVYWSAISAQYGLYRGKIDGVDTERIKTTTGKVYGIAFDWIAKNIYYADFDNNQIGVCTQTGGSCAVLLENMTAPVRWPTGIALDPERGYMYWTNRGNGSESVAMAGMDGSNPTTIAKSMGGYPGGITFDFESSRLFWVDQKLKTIESMDLDGMDRKTVANLKMYSTPFGIDVFGKTLYWSEFHTKKIYKLGKGGKDESKFVSDTGHYVRHIAVYHEAKQKKDIANHCEGSVCSLCVLAPGTFACKSS